MEKCVIDSDIIIRYLLNDHLELFKKSRDLFDLIKLGKVRCFLEQAVFIETIFILSKGYQIPRKEIAKALRNLLMYKGVLNSDKDVLFKALQFYTDTDLHIIDCIFIAKATINNIRVMTFDQELKDLLAQNASSNEDEVPRNSTPT